MPQAARCRQSRPLTPHQYARKRPTMCSETKQEFSDSYVYRLLKRLSDNPEMTQRELAREVGLSLGTINYCLQAFVEKGWIKTVNFTNSKKKAAYIYKLTPAGIEEKGRATVRFLKYKAKEYRQIKAEMKELRREVEGAGD